MLSDKFRKPSIVFIFFFFFSFSSRLKGETYPHVSRNRLFITGLILKLNVYLITLMMTPQSTFFIKPSAVHKTVLRSIVHALLEEGRK